MNRPPVSAGAGVARIFRLLSFVVAAHGALVAVFAAGIEPRLGESAPGPLASFVFFFLYIPASALALPLLPLLWKCGLMQTPGWFAWPKPLGYVVVYAAWVVALLALSLLMSRLAGAKGGGQQSGPVVK